MNNTKHTVFVVQDPDGKEIAFAAQYGEFKVILTGKESVDQAIVKLIRALSVIKPGDFLLQIGKPINIGLATHFALLYGGGNLNLLVWRREQYKYIIEEIRLDGHAIPAR